MKILLLTAFCTLPFPGKAQLNTDTITTKTFRNGKPMYFHGDIRLTESKLNKTLKTDPVSKKTIQSAQTNNVFGTILGTSGSVLVGFPIGVYISGGEMKWGIAGAGLALVAGSLVLHSNAIKLKRKAINQFNEGVNYRTTFLQRSEINVGASNNGIGLTWRF